MAMESYVVQYAFYVALLSESKMQIGDYIEFDEKTRKARYNGKEATVPLLATALKEGWILRESEVGKKVPVQTVAQANARYPVATERGAVNKVSTRRASLSKGSVEAQDEKPVSQVRLFTSANVGALDISKGEFQALQQQNRIAEAQRVRLAAQNSPLPKVSYTEGVTVTTTTGNRANRPGSDQVWDGGTQSDVVGRVSDRGNRRIAAPSYADMHEEEYDEEYPDQEGADFSDEDYESDEESYEEVPTEEEIRERVGIVLSALPKAHAEDVKLHIAILMAIYPGFPAWDPRAHWKKKVKAYQDQIEGNATFETALRLVETDAFWKHINK